MTPQYRRANASVGHPITLRGVIRSDAGEFTDAPTLAWNVYSADDDKKTLYTATADFVHRIRQGVYETVIPSRILAKPGVYHDTLTAAGVSRHTDRFTLHQHAPPLVGYASIAHIRREDPQLDDEKAFPDETINNAVAAASALMDRWTGRWFVPRWQTVVLDGSGTRTLTLPQPLLHLEALYPCLNQGQNPNAADWDNPCLTGAFFPRGRRNIRVTGLFGTVDEDEETPAAIVQATARLAARRLLERAGDGGVSGPVVSEHTDGHAYQRALSPAAREAYFSGDPDIDAVVAAHQRPVVTGNAL